MKNYKELYRWDDPVLDQAFDRMVVSIHMCRQEKGSKVFLTCGCEPRTGVTTVAINAAIAMASAGWKTVLIDADLRKDGRYKHLQENNTRGVHLAGYLEGNLAVEDILYGTNHDDLVYIPGGVTTKPPISLLCAPGMNTLLERLKEEYDYIFIDAPANGAAVDAGILGTLADEVVLVAAWDRTTVSQIAAARRDMEQSGAHILGIVVNHVEFASYNHMNKNHRYFIEKGYERDYKKAMKRKEKEKKKGSGAARETQTGGTTNGN